MPRTVPESLHLGKHHSIKLNFFVCVAKMRKDTLKVRGGHRKVEQLPKAVEGVIFKIKRPSKGRHNKCLFEINKNSYSRRKTSDKLRVFWLGEEGNGYLLERKGELLHQ